MFVIFKKYPNLFCAFSEKNDGSMKLTSNPLPSEKISRNRENYFKKSDTNPAKMISAEIVHGRKVEIVSENDCGKIITGADGLVSQIKNIYLSITSADCLPIFLFEPEKEIAGMVHAGWRSLEKNILANAVEKMRELGGKPENILVGIGPAICQKHYAVGPEVAEKFTGYPEAIKRKDNNFRLQNHTMSFPPASSRLQRGERKRESSEFLRSWIPDQVGDDKKTHFAVQDNKIFLDIKKIAQRQLLDLGLLGKNIETSPECTFELSEKYFSARRDLSLTNCPKIISTNSCKDYDPAKQQLVRDKKEIEAMIAVVGIGL